jgi:hypothetical protein
MPSQLGGICPEGICGLTVTGRQVWMRTTPWHS